MAQMAALRYQSKGWFDWTMEEDVDGNAHADRICTRRMLQGNGQHEAHEKCTQERVRFKKPVQWRSSVAMATTIPVPRANRTFR